MTVIDDLAEVVELACLTEDRTDAEQAALLAVAARVDAQRNRLTTTNHRQGPASRLYRLAGTTREHGQPHRMNAAVLERLDRQANRWDRWRPRP